MKIQVLGSGCPTCENLHKSVEEVVKDLNLDLEVEYSTDIAKIVELGAMSGPVFAIDGQTITCGKVPCAQKIKKAILSAQKNKPTQIKQSNENACSCGGNC
ncbi:MAG: thioredoxin family protein [Candidatus Moranbacteria bacterium]|nr:thioredoxin family protein [Candidatus Moranbacteria bacterium]